MTGVQDTSNFRNLSIQHESSYIRFNHPKPLRSSFCDIIGTVGTILEPASPIPLVKEASKGYGMEEEVTLRTQRDFSGGCNSQHLNDKTADIAKAHTRERGDCQYI